MPVPQKINFLVEQARCLLLTMVDVSLTAEGAERREEEREDLKVLL